MRQEAQEVAYAVPELHKLLMGSQGVASGRIGLHSAWKTGGKKIGDFLE
jgi:hypothetical protein